MPLSTRTAARTTATLLAGFGAFQACLACGAPWGRFAYGGGHDGRLPTNLRRVSAVAAPVYAVAAVLVASEAGPARWRRPALTGLATYLAFGAVLNLASRSRPERLTWAPACAVTAVTAWQARPQ